MAFNRLHRHFNFNVRKFKKKCETWSFSPSSDHKKKNYSSLDSPRWGASNGGKFTSLASIDRLLMRIFKKHSPWVIERSIGAKDLILLPFDASRWEDSNELWLVIVRSLNGRIFVFSHFFLKSDRTEPNRTVSVPNRTENRTEFLVGSGSVPGSNRNRSELY